MIFRCEARYRCQRKKRGYCSDGVIRCPTINNFPVREMWFSVKSFDPEKSFISFARLVVKVRDPLQVSIVGIQKRPYLREGSDVVVHVLHFCVSDICDPCPRILQFGGGLTEFLGQDSVVMFLNRKRDGEDCD